MRAILMAVAVTLSACAGPSKNQLRQLLHECREVNREHLRMIKAYDAEVAKCVKLRGPHGEEGNFGWACPTDMTPPEQSFGGAEYGVGAH